MSAESDFLANAVLNYLFNGAAMPTLASGLYIALCTTATSDAALGTEVSTSGTAYARLNIARNTTNFPTATTGTISNGTLLQFAVATASWGTITHWAIMDASTGGNILYHAALSSSVAISTNDRFELPIGNLTATEA